MKKAFIVPVSILFMMGLMAGTASAQTYVVPCFEWQCDTGSQGNCTFDAGQCSSGGGVWFWHWNFGDGTSDWWNTSPIISHYYSTGLSANVTLTLSFFGKAEEDTTCWVEYRRVIGPQAQYFKGDCEDSLYPGCNCQ